MIGFVMRYWPELVAAGGGATVVLIVDRVIAGIVAWQMGVVL